MADPSPTAEPRWLTNFTMLIWMPIWAPALLTGLVVGWIVEGFRRGYHAAQEVFRGGTN